MKGLAVAGIETWNIGDWAKHVYIIKSRPLLLYYA